MQVLLLGNICHPSFSFKVKIFMSCEQHSNQLVQDRLFLKELDEQHCFSKIGMQHIPFVSDKKKPVILTCDEHGSHLTYHTIIKAMEQTIVCLPPNMSLALQPLVAVFKPFKEQPRRILLQSTKKLK